MAHENEHSSTMISTCSSTRDHGGAKADFMMFGHDARISLLSKAFERPTMRRCATQLFAPSAASCCAKLVRPSATAARRRFEPNSARAGRERAEARAHGFNPVDITHRESAAPMRPTAAAASRAAHRGSTRQEYVI